MESTNLIDYLKIADKFRNDEQNRVNQILTWDVGFEVLKAFRKEMLIKPQVELLNKGDGFQQFLNQKRYDDIKLLFELYKEETACLKPIGDQMRTYIINLGRNMLKAVVITSPEGKTLGVKEIITKSEIVEKLIGMLDEFLHIVNYCFDQNTSFQIQRAQGFESFINFEVGQYTVSEILATYTDNILRKNGLKLP